MITIATRAWIGVFLALLAALAPGGCAPTPTPARAAGPRGRTIPAEGRTLAALIALAKAGDRIVLGEGRYEGGVTLPPGVGLAGVGASRTVIDARGTAVGLAIEGGSGAEIADLSIRDARRTNLAIKGAGDVSVRRVHASGGITGIAMERVIVGRVEDSVASGNRYGVVVGGGSDVSVVNCTMVGNASLGLGLPSGVRTVAFNNVIADGSMGVYLGEEARGCRLDHNLYYTLFVGKQAGQVGRKSIGDWHALTGQDGRSVRTSITFRAPVSGDFRPSSAREWGPGASTTGLGVVEFAGIRAPGLDMAGRPRSPRPDVGAFEAEVDPASPVDGTLTVRGDPGLKSAGVFRPEGRLVAYLFHNLPLVKGKYPFRLPSKDFQGRPIEAGSYEVRVVEGDLRWDYLGWVGDTGGAFPASSTASVNPLRAAFDESGILIVQQGWSEDGANLRGYDAANGRWLWAFEGRSETLGLAVGGDGAAYSLRPDGTRGQVTRLDPRTGKVAATEGWPGGQASFEGASRASGFAELDGRIYVADAPANRTRSAPVGRPTFDRDFPVDAPSALEADRSRHILWILSGDHLIAVGPDGRTIARAGPIPSPAALAARDGRVAVASRATGRVHLFDAADLGAIRPIGAIGTGDGSAGPIAADRFTFRASGESGGSHVGLALGPEGRLAVAERNRLIVFGRDGRALWSTFGLFGNGTRPSHADPLRVYDTDGRTTLRLDEARGTWEPESILDLPVGEFLGDFAASGRPFGVILSPNAAPPSRDLTVYALEGPKPRPTFALIRDPASRRYLALRDADRDGRIDLRDRLASTPEIEGAQDTFGRDTTLHPDGSLITPGQGSAPWATIVPASGLDSPDGPAFALDRARRIPRAAEGLISPYTLSPEPNADVTAATPTADGGVIANVRLRSSPGGVGLFNNAGTDLVRFDATGRPTWLHPLERHQGIEGLSTVGPVTIAGVGVTSEVLAFDPDGLGLGSFGPASRVHYEGYFLDHPGAVRAYRGRDGRTYALIADNYGGRHHWWRLGGAETITSTRAPLAIDPAAATRIAARPAPKGRTLGRPSTPVVRIPRLDRDLPIDGGLAKWREAGVTPQVIVTPETSSGPVQDPRDMSALVRLAYRGSDLYAQFLQFDDVVTFHQPVARHYQHDGVELILNGFGQGFKFDATKAVDAGPILIRSRFYLQNLEALLDPAQAPRSIRVLDDARDVPERELIESVYGIDLARCRVIVTEFKLPIDATTYRGSTESMIPMKPGQTFRLGLLINDNDEPGTDLQHYLVWPATYSNFGPVEDGALAVLE